MQLKGKTVLITGGASGIGLEAAKQFIAKDAKVIITGRNQEKIDATLKSLPGITAIKSDVSDAGEARLLFEQVRLLGGIDILYNNAGVLTTPINLGMADDRHFDDAAYEINVNYLSVVRLNDLFMDMLKSRKESAIINTTSLLSYVPAILEATYSASKVALQFYTRTLRKHLEILNSNVKVFELLPPLVATEMTAARDDKKMTPEKMVNELIAGLENDRLTIRVGDSKTVYLLNRFFPKLAFSLVNPKRSYELLIHN
ncbi:SDR family oxidoreductase [Mucilaginibacter terrae]|uniref:Oxidoreductase n=1 Tax=Mucilaginibacter terrae TaxID=1955052 RepID=A0ABU3H054_9SPHI|nr:SDR family NAD(P)-dependent oxidoreductase [Mucilaginibacter terrae]MDT3405388.1 putative oxidoreductase [Mucilaginibacter terrae]